MVITKNPSLKILIRVNDIQKLPISTILCSYVVFVVIAVNENIICLGRLAVVPDQEEPWCRKDTKYYVR